MSGCPGHCYLRCCLNLAILTFSIIFTVVQVTTPPLLDSSPGVSLLPLWSPIVCSLVAQKIKNLPSMQETRVRSLGWEGPLEKGMASHSRILAWRIPWTEEPGYW